MLRAIVERHSDDATALRRRYRLDWTEATNRRLREFFEEEQARLEAVDFDALDRDGRIDYLLQRNHLRFQLRDLARARERFEELTPFLPFAPIIARLAESPGIGEPISAQAAAASLHRISRMLEGIRCERRKDGEATRSDRLLAYRAAGATRAMAEALDDWHSFHAGYDPLFTWWCAEPFARAHADLLAYARFLSRVAEGKEPSEDEDAEGRVDAGEEAALAGDPIGREAVLDALQSEFIPYNPQELIGIAERELAWCRAEYRRASAELGVADWRSALDHVSERHVPPGEQPALIRKLADEAVDFLEARDLVTIPELCKESWRMRMMSPERQRVNPFFTGGEVISVSYPTAGMSHEDKLMSMRGNNPHFSRATVHHELIPGHHLQGFMASRYRSHRQLFRTPFLVEGWALYWEMLLWDLGFPATPEDRVGMLFWRSHRCARIIFSLKFHLGEMSAEEAVDFLVEEVGHERRNATGEVRRSIAGGYSPLYQAAYMIGGLQLRALRDELVTSGQMTNRQFHDSVLRQNAIPIELIRAALTDQALTPEYETSWRFYE